MAMLKVVSSLLLLTASAFALKGAMGGGELLDPPPPPVNTEFAGVLLRIGLGADALAAAGVTSTQVPGLVAAVEQNYSAATLGIRDDAYIAARQTHDRLRRLLQSGKGSEADVAALRTAEQTLAGATSARDTYLFGLRTAALATVTAEQSTLVGRINANHPWGLPPQYLVKDRAQADWVALREAIDAKRISQEDEEEELPAAVQTYLAARDAEVEISTAKTNLDTNIATVQTAWNTAAAH